MSILISFILLLITFFFIVFLPLYLLLTIDSLLRSHDLPTSKRAFKTICKIISEHKADINNFYDLGCGRGDLAIAVKKKFPFLSVYGIDKNRIRIFFARLKAHFLGQKISFQKRDLFLTDIQNADIVYTYLWYDLMPPLERKLQKELKKGTVVITNTSNFPKWKPSETYITCFKKPNFEKLFVYIKD